MKPFSDRYLNYDKSFLISRKYPGHLNVTLSCMWLFYFSLISHHSVYQSLRVDSITLSWRTFWLSHASGYGICNIEFPVRNLSIPQGHSLLQTLRQSGSLSRRSSISFAYFISTLLQIHFLLLPVLAKNPFFMFRSCFSHLLKSHHSRPLISFQNYPLPWNHWLK